MASSPTAKQSLKAKLTRSLFVRMWGFRNLVADSLAAERSADPWFDPAYRKWLGAGEETYADYLALAPETRGAPCARLVRLASAQGLVTNEQLSKLALASTRMGDKVKRSMLDRLCAMFVPTYYRRVAGLDDTRGDIDALAHFLGEGLNAGLFPTPLFDAAHYAALAEPALRRGENALLHWIEKGVPRRIVPTPLFDEAFYQDTYTDIAAGKLWGFEHFAHHGVYEGRRPFKMVNILWTSPQASVASRGPSTALDLLISLSIGIETPAGPYEGTGLDLRRAQHRQAQLEQSPLFAEIFKRAAAHEPAVGDPSQDRVVVFPPHHNLLARLQTTLAARLPRRHYDIVICVPFGHLGGSDLVAGLLSRSLRRLFPDQSILLLRTDRPDFKRPDWYEPTADIVDMSDLTGQLERQYSEFFLFTVLRGLGPSRLFNVNSNLCWTSLQRYGSRLKPSMDIYAYLFCWDLTETGRRAGYPGDFFASTIPHLSALFTDTDHLRDDLIQTFAVPSSTRDRMVRLWTPAMATPSVTTLAEKQVARHGSRPVILWAGRLDRQKRFDLAVAVARLLPAVEFRCWGVAVLDDGSTALDLPSNMTLSGAFHSIADLPLEEADGWLYTSAWDGLPTILIELGALGMPIVASAVGGVPELVTPECGWPLPPDADAQAYADAITAMLDAPDERIRRAANLRNRVAERHDEAVYDAALARVLTGTSS